MSLSETQNGDVSEETVGDGKVKKSLKQSVSVGLSEAQNGDVYTKPHTIKPRLNLITVSALPEIKTNILT